MPKTLRMAAMLRSAFSPSFRVGRFFLLLLLAVHVLGCGRSMGVKSQLSFSGVELSKQIRDMSGLHMILDPKSQKIVLVGFNQGQLRVGSFHEGATGGSWDQGESFSVGSEPNEHGLLRCGSSLVYLWSDSPGGQLESLRLHAAESQDGGKTWQPLKNLEQPGGFPVGGTAGLYAVKSFDGTKLELTQASLSLMEWNLSVAEVRPPDGLSGETQMRVSGLPRLVVDQKDRIHFLCEVSLRSKDNTQEGVLYGRSEDGKTFTTKFFECTRADLAADPQSGDAMLLALLAIKKSEGNQDKRPEKFPAVSLTQDGGKSWSSPFPIDTPDVGYEGVQAGCCDRKMLLFVRRSHMEGLRIPVNDNATYDSGNGGKSWSVAQKRDLVPNSIAVRKDAVCLFYTQEPAVLIGKFR